MVDVAIPPGLYWLAVLAGVASPNLRQFSNGPPGILGIDPATFQNVSGYQQALAYGPLPTTFPGTATFKAVPVTFVLLLRYSA